MTALEWGFITAVTVALIGLISAVLQRRTTKAQKETAKLQQEAVSVDILKDITSELRAELDRQVKDAAQRLADERVRTKELEAENAELRTQIVGAHKQSRAAHETAGRALERIEYLEMVLRKNGIVFDPGPLA